MGRCGGGSRSQSKTIQQPQQSKIRKNVNFTQLIKIGPGLYFSTTRKDLYRKNTEKNVHSLQDY